MPTEEYELLKEALRQTPTPEARKAAAEAMRKYEKRVRGSKPTLVSLGLKKTYPHSVPLDKMAEEIERNPEFYDLVKRIVTRER